jgi:hypothetical protein
MISTKLCAFYNIMKLSSMQSTCSTQKYFIKGWLLYATLFNLNKTSRRNTKNQTPKCKKATPKTGLLWISRESIQIIILLLCMEFSHCLNLYILYIVFCPMLCISSHWLGLGSFVYPLSFRLMTTLLITFLKASLFLNLHPITLKMEAACSFETSVSAHKTTRCNNPEDHNLNNHSRENLKSSVSNATGYGLHKWVRILIWIASGGHPPSKRLEGGGWSRSGQ